MNEGLVDIDHKSLAFKLFLKDFFTDAAEDLLFFGEITISLDILFLHSGILYGLFYRKMSEIEWLIRVHFPMAFSRAYCAIFISHCSAMCFIVVISNYTSVMARERTLKTLSIIGSWTLVYFLYFWNSLGGGEIAASILFHLLFHYLIDRLLKRCLLIETMVKVLSHIADRKVDVLSEVYVISCRTKKNTCRSHDS